MNKSSFCRCYSYCCLVCSVDRKRGRDRHDPFISSVRDPLTMNGLRWFCLFVFCLFLSSCCSLFFSAFLAFMNYEYLQRNQILVHGIVETPADQSNQSKMNGVPLKPSRFIIEY